MTAYDRTACLIKLEDVSQIFWGLLTLLSVCYLICEVEPEKGKRGFIPKRKTHTSA